MGWPCGSNDLIFVGCGETRPTGTGQPYVDWQVGAGAMDVTAALGRVDVLSPPAAALKKPKKQH